MSIVRGPRSALAVVGIAELLAMTLWFSASAVGPELAAAWELDPAAQAWLTNAVQLGFVVGAVVSASLTLSDVIRPRRLFAASAGLGALATAAIALFVSSGQSAIALRFLTGVALAGVYPTGMKMMAGWFREGRGAALGVLVGALTIGSAMPHLLRAVGGVGRPRLVLLLAAGMAGGAALLVLGYEDGPHLSASAPFDPGAITRILRDRPTVLADLGYFGHMWELYAVWTWLPAYLAASFEASGAGGTTAATRASLVTFGAIAVGGAGAWLFGWAADRWGRTTMTAISMVTSGAACVGAGLAFGASTILVATFVLAWGFVIVADSAQFSTAVSELADDSYVGSALTLQTAVGFLLTVGSIQLVPIFAELLGWRWAFAPFAVGPAIGTLAMLRLRRLPAAEMLAGGRG